MITQVYLEIGSKRTFAGAIAWPGWCRSGRDEASALAALVAYGHRYGRALAPLQLEFQSPADVSTLVVVERLSGNATTDFGAPAVAPASDAGPIDDNELHRLQAILQACWQAFDQAAIAARGKELGKGPRGGGRNLENIIHHVLEAEEAYLSQLGWTFRASETVDLSQRLGQARQAVLEGLAAAARGSIAAIGARGGARWKPRYFVRRVAWHVLDHAWEIEDRIQ